MSAQGRAQFTPGPTCTCEIVMRTGETLDSSLGDRPCSDISRIVLCPLHTAAPAMYEALTNLLPEEDIVSTDNGPDECRWCGRIYLDNDNEEELQVLCTFDDCPGYIARQAITQAEGR